MKDVVWHALRWMGVNDWLCGFLISLLVNIHHLLFHVVIRSSYVPGVHTPCFYGITRLNDSTLVM